MSINGPSDRVNLNRLQQAPGAAPAGPAAASGPASSIFSLKSPERAGAAPASASPAASHGAMVQRIRERLASGQSPDAVLHDEVGREVTALVGRADPRLVKRITEDVRQDPALSDLFQQLVRRASDNSAGTGIPG